MEHNTILKTIIIALGSASVLLGGCAKTNTVVKTTPPEAAPAQTARTTTQQPVSTAKTTAPEVHAPAPSTPAAPVSIEELTRRLTSHPRVLWHSRTSTYRYYMGGILMAEYFPDKKMLTIHSESPADDTTCRYTLDGQLKSESKDLRQRCDELVKELNQVLSR